MLKVSEVTVPQEIMMYVMTSQYVDTNDRVIPSKCIFRKKVPFSFIPNIGEDIQVRDGFCAHRGISISKCYHSELSVYVYINEYDRDDEYGPSLI